MDYQQNDAKRSGFWKDLIAEESRLHLEASLYCGSVIFEGEIKSYWVEQQSEPDYVAYHVEFLDGGDMAINVQGGVVQCVIGTGVDIRMTESDLIVSPHKAA